MVSALLTHSGFLDHGVVPLDSARHDHTPPKAHPTGRKRRRWTEHMSPLPAPRPRRLIRRPLLFCHLPRVAAALRVVALCRVLRPSRGGLLLGEREGESEQSS